MKYYEYCEPHDIDFRISKIVVLSEYQILDYYYEWWKSGMTKIGRQSLISEQNCLEDWQVVHWAQFIGEF